MGSPGGNGTDDAAKEKLKEQFRIQEEQVVVQKLMEVLVEKNGGTPTHTRRMSQGSTARNLLTSSGTAWDYVDYDKAVLPPPSPLPSPGLRVHTKSSRLLWL
jgi:hypothetical protein